MAKVVAIVSILAAAAAGMAVWLGASDSGEPDRATVAEKPFGSVRLPEGWHVYQDGSTSTWLELYTNTVTIDTCEPGEDTTVNMGIGDETMFEARDEYPPRPDRFDPSFGTGFRQGDEHACGEREQELRFVDKGRRFYVSLIVGENAPKSRVAEAYEILNSLRTESL